MKKGLKVFVLAMLGATIAAAASAQAPATGTWKSSLAEILEGRQATSWSAASGHYQLGNVINQASWDGATLGGEWKIVCPVITNTTTLVNIPGIQKITQIDYVGGYIWLSGAGPWAGGDASYVGTITTYVEIRTEQFPGAYGTTENHNISATVNGYPGVCITGQWNGAWLGDTDASAKPANFPDFLDTDCNPTPTLGRWGLDNGITLHVTGCEVPVERSTWGAVKSRYLD